MRKLPKQQPKMKRQESTNGRGRSKSVMGGFLQRAESEVPQDAACDLFDRFTIGVDDEGCSFAIEWFADGEDIGNFFVDGSSGEAGSGVGMISIAAESGGEGFW